MLENRFATKGTVLSDVLDTKLQSRWGTMNWKADRRAASVAVRSGNVADPDDTWSAWSAEQTDADLGKAVAPIGAICSIASRSPAM